MFWVFSGSVEESQKEYRCDMFFSWGGREVRVSGSDFPTPILAVVGSRKQMGYSWLMHPKRSSVSSSLGMERPNWFFVQP